MNNQKINTQQSILISKEKKGTINIHNERLKEYIHNDD